MKFNYQARTKEGEVQMGTIEAPNREVAASLLQKQGFYLTFLEEAEKKPFYARKIKLFEKVSRKDIVIFSRQLSILFKSQVPLLESLRTLARQAKDPFKEKIVKISEEIEGGSSLSNALALYPEIFSTLYVSMVKSGEVSGKLSEVLTYLADHLERDYELNSKLKGAMIYPIFILGVLFLVGLVMIYYVLPQLTGILKEIGGNLPLLTKVIIAFSDFLRTKGYLIFIPLILVILYIQRYIKTKEGKKVFDEISLKVPVLGSFLKMTSLARFAGNLSTLISGGLPIVKALEVTEGVVGNTLYKEMIFETMEAVRRGETISSVLGKYPEIVPPLVTQMAIVGERTGQLDNALENIVDFYQKEVERGVDRLISLIEPILLIFLGSIVGIFVSAILLPIYNIGGMGEM